MKRLRFPQLYDEAWLRTRYTVDRLSTPQIAAEIGCTPSRVQQRLHALNVTMRGRYPDSWKSKDCEKCGGTYIPSGPAQRFCSQRCQRGVRECAFCGTEFLLSLANTQNRWCSQRCYWEHKKANGKQGRYLTQEGYIRLSVPVGTPGRQGDGRMPEHRYVMQEALGRMLETHETVHHINGVKDDNRLENLQVRQGRHGKGIVMVCNACGSHDVAGQKLAAIRTATVTVT